MVQRQVINASVSPKGSLETLSQREVQQLSEVGSGTSYTLFRQCVLAILNTGAHVDNAKTILEAYLDFEVRIHQQDRGVRLELKRNIRCLNNFLNLPVPAQFFYCLVWLPL